MQPTNDQEVLLAHDAWATRNILQACVPLSDAQFHQVFDIGPGSLHNTTAHILGAMGRWEDVLRKGEIRTRLDQDGNKRTAAELLAVFDKVAADFAQAATMGSPADLLTRTREGKTYTFPRSGIVLHVVTHGMHHRAQCLNMLKHIGVNPLPQSSVTEWMLATGAAKVS